MTKIPQKFRFESYHHALRQDIHRDRWRWGVFGMENGRRGEVPVMVLTQRVHSTDLPLLFPLRKRGPRKSWRSCSWKLVSIWYDCESWSGGLCCSLKENSQIYRKHIDQWLRHYFSGAASSFVLRPQYPQATPNQWRRKEVELCRVISPRGRSLFTGNFRTGTSRWSGWDFLRKQWSCLRIFLPNPF